MARKKGMKFRTAKERDAARLKRFALGFAAFLLVFAVVSVIYIFKAYHISFSDFSGKEETSDTTDSADAGTAVLSGDSSFMLACASEDTDELYFVFAVYADLDRREVRIYPIDTDRKCTVDGVEDSVEGHYRRTSVRGLKAAADAVCGFETRRYIVSNDSQFKNAINVMDGAQITVPARIDYKSSAFNLSLMPGEQNIKGETLLKYFRYLGIKGGGQAQAELLCSVISQYISNSYVSVGKAYFSELSNYVNSDITIVDFSRALPQLEAAAKADPAMKYITVSSPQELRPAENE